MGNADEALYAARDLAPRLVSEFGYGPELAEEAARELSSADAGVQRPFWRWWSTGELDNSIEIEGYTVGRLMAERGQQPVAAFRLLAWIAADSATALRRLRRGRERAPVFAVAAAARGGGEASAADGAALLEEARVPAVGGGEGPSATPDSGDPAEMPRQGDPESRVTSPRRSRKRVVPK